MKLREGNVFTPACDSFCLSGGGGGCGERWCGRHPLNPEADTPRTQRLTLPPLQVETATEASDMHPTGIHSCKIM